MIFFVVPFTSARAALEAGKGRCCQEERAGRVSSAGRGWRESVEIGEITLAYLGNGTE